MSLIKWDPFKDLDRFFNDDFSRLVPMRNQSAMDMYEKDGSMIIEMETPGIPSDNIEVSVEKGHLRIEGQHEEKQEEEKKNYYSKQIRRGSFSRIIPLPDGVVEDSIEAEAKDGVLRISYVLPSEQAESAERKKIDVKKK